MQKNQSQSSKNISPVNDFEIDIEACDHEDNTHKDREFVERWISLDDMASEKTLEELEDGVAYHKCTKNGTFVTRKVNVDWLNSSKKKHKFKKKGRRLSSLLTKIASAKSHVQHLNYGFPYVERHFDNMDFYRKSEIMLNVLSYMRFDPLWLVKNRGSQIQSHYWKSIYDILNIFFFKTSSYDLSKTHYATKRESSFSLVAEDCATQPLHIVWKAGSVVRILTVHVPKAADIRCPSLTSILIDAQCIDNNLIDKGFVHPDRSLPFYGENQAKSANKYADMVSLYEEDVQLYAQGNGEDSSDSQGKEEESDEEQEEGVDVDKNYVTPEEKESEGLFKKIYNNTFGLPGSIRSSVKNVEKKADDLAGDAKEFLDDLKSKFGKYDEKISSVFELLESKIANLFCFKAVYEHVSAAIKSSFKFLSDYSFALIALCCVCLVLFYMFAGTEYFDVVATVVAILSVLIGISNVSRITGMVAQGSEDVLKFFYEVCAGMVKIITNAKNSFCDFNSFRSKISLDKLGSMSRNIKNIADLVTNLPKYTEFIKDCFDWVRDQVYKFFYGLPYSISANIGQRIVELTVKIHQKPENYTINAIDCLINKTKKVTEEGINTPLYRVMMNCHTMLTLARDKLAMKQLSDSRGGVSPLVVKIRGLSGKGKSTAVTALASGLAQYFVGHESVYYRNVTDEYFSQWLDQFVTVYDDFGQETDSESNPNPAYRELISIKNIAPYILNMAAVEDKGRFVFNSGIVILSTNHDHFGTGILKSLTRPEALERRFDICIHQTDRDAFVLERVFAKETAPIVFDLEGLLRYLIQCYVAHYTREYHVSQILKDRVAKVIADLQHKLDQRHMMSFDVYQNFIRWRALAQNGQRIAEKEMRTYEKLNKIFKKMEDTVTIETFTARIERYKDIVLTNEDLEILWTCSDGRQVMTVKEDPESEFDIETLSLEPISFRKWGLDLLEFRAIKGCDCLEDRNYHISGDFERIPSDIKLQLLKIKTRIEESEDTAIPNIDPCPFYIAKTLNFPVYKLMNSCKSEDIKYLIAHGYNCTCDETRGPCDKNHTFALTAEVGRKALSFVAVAFMRALEQDRKGAEVINKTELTKSVAPGWKTMLSRWWSARGDVLQYISLAGAIVCGAIGLLSIYRSFIAKKLEAQVSNPPQAVRMTQQSVIPYAQGACAQMFNIDGGKTDSTGHDMMRSVIEHQARVYDDASGVELMNALFVDAYHFLIMHHLFYKVGEGNVLRFEFVHGATTHKGFKLKISDITKVQLMDPTGKEPCDVVLCALPAGKHLPGMGSIFSKFLVCKDLLRVDGCRLVLSILNKLPQLWPCLYAVRKGKVCLQREKYMVDKHGVEEIEYCSKALKYDYGGRFGDCATPVMAVMHFADHGRRLAGLHVAGSSSAGIGMAVVLTQEQIRAGIERIALMEPNVKRLSYEPLLAQGYAGPILYICDDEEELVETGAPKNGLCYLGKKDKQFSSLDSKLVLSPIGETGEITRKKGAAPLRPIEINGEIVDPNELALKKFLVPIHFADKDILDLCVSDLKTKYMNTMDEIDTSVLTEYEAIRGIPGTSITSINMKTSLGYKWKDIGKGCGKRGLIDFDRGVLKEPLRSAVNMRLEKARQGIAMEAIFEDCLKDEKRPLEKIEKGKTRLFSAGPVDLLVCMKMYFGRFVAWFMDNRIEDEAALGINCTSEEWHQMSIYLHSFGKNFLDGDFENFDATQLRDFLWEILGIINWWYGEDNPDNIVRMALFYPVVGAVHINRGWFYTVFGCNPSGNFLTSVINSMYGQLFFRYCYYSSMPGHFPIGKFAFHKHVALVTFGDDNIQGVSNEVMSFYNPTNISRVAQSIGMGFTTADKKKVEVDRPFSSLSECSFLKRAFVLDPEESLWIAPLDLDTILEIVNWCWLRASKREMADSCEQAIRELALHPKAIYEYWTSRILKLARQCSYPGIVTATWRGYRNSMLRGNDACNEGFLL